jgi:hypothetical protein
MPRKGYQTVTIKDEVVAILDSLGGSRSDTLSRIILQHKLALQRTSAQSEGKTPTELIVHIKEKLPYFTRQQIIDLIVEALVFLK